MDRPPRGGFFFDSLPPGNFAAYHSTVLPRALDDVRPSQSGEEFLRYSATAGKGYSSQISARSLSLLSLPSRSPSPLGAFPLLF